MLVCDMQGSQVQGEKKKKSSAHCFAYLGVDSLPFILEIIWFLTEFAFISKDIKFLMFNLKVFSISSFQSHL